MDRFIGDSDKVTDEYLTNLKSNMDRFIVSIHYDGFKGYVI